MKLFMNTVKLISDEGYQDLSDEITIIEIFFNLGTLFFRSRKNPHHYSSYLQGHLIWHVAEINIVVYFLPTYFILYLNVARQRTGQGTDSQYSSSTLPQLEAVF